MDLKLFFILTLLSMVFKNIYLIFKCNKNNIYNGLLVLDIALSTNRLVFFGVYEWNTHLGSIISLFLDLVLVIVLMLKFQIYIVKLLRKEINFFNASL